MFIYLCLTKELYIEPKEEEVLGSFLIENESRESTERIQNRQRSTTLVRRKEPPKPISKDIRTFFKDKNKSTENETETEIIEID